MSFELEWGLALGAVAVFVAVLFLLPKKKKLPTPKSFGRDDIDDDDLPPVKPQFFAVLRSLWSNPAVYAVCEVPDEVLFLRVSTYHPNMSFGTVRGRSFLAQFEGGSKGILWMIASTMVVGGLLGLAYSFGLTEVAGELGLVLFILVAVILLLGCLVVLVGPLTFFGRMIAEWQFARETTKVENLRVKELRRAASDKPHLRADLNDLGDLDIEWFRNDDTGKVATLQFQHDPTGTWKFDLYSEEDADAACQIFGLPNPRARRRRRP